MLKARFGLASVPFCMVFDKVCGLVVLHHLSIYAVLSLRSTVTPPPTSTPNLVDKTNLHAQEGRLTEMGNPKRVDLDAALSSLLGKAPPVAGSLQPQQALTLDEDF